MGWWWASREQVAKAKVNEVRPRKLVATPCTLRTNINEALYTPAQERWHPPSVIAPDRRASQDQPGPINASCILSGPKFQLHLDFATPTTTTTTATLLLPIGNPPTPLNRAPTHAQPHDVIENDSTDSKVLRPGPVQGGGTGSNSSSRSGGRHTPQLPTRLRDCSRWQPRQALWRSEGPRPHLPEPLRPIPSRPEEREEDGRLAQDEGDRTQGPRLDHRRDQGLWPARKRRCWLPLRVEMGTLCSIRLDSPTICALVHAHSS